MSLRAIHTNHYDFHGLGITISGGAEVATAIHSRLMQFPPGDRASSKLRFEYLSALGMKNSVAESAHGRARTVYEFPSGEVLYAEEADCLYINCGERIKVSCDPAQGFVQLSMIETQEADLWLTSHPLFTLPLVELLKRRGLFALHAAALCVGGKGLVLPGSSGAGKSTLTIALLRAGFGFLADDTIFLTGVQEGLKVLAFPDEIGVADETARLFPELNYLLDLPKHPGSHKRQIRAEDVYQVRTPWDCRPSAVVFPRVADSERSEIEPMSEDEALMELVPNILLTEALSSQAHLDTLVQLVSGCGCYRLHTGRDFDAVPDILRGLVN